jgi:hypothetical protein
VLEFGAVDAASAREAVDIEAHVVEEAEQGGAVYWTEPEEVDNPGLVDLPAVGSEIVAELYGELVAVDSLEQGSEVEY